MTLGRRSALSFVGGSALAACLPWTTARAAADQLRIAYPIDIPHWDPEGQTGGPPMSILNSVFDSPIGQAPDMTLIPRALSEWKWSPDKSSLDVRLRDDLYFHNGDKLTTEDLKYTF